MNDAEQQAIELIQNNQNLSDDLKQRYILALFLMDDKEQREYLKLLKAFSYRCEVAERGIFMVNPDEANTIMRTLDDVKKDIINKITHSHNK